MIGRFNPLFYNQFLMKTYLNLGCGNRYHSDWTNVDFVSTGEDVLAHNLLQGIPFEDNHFKVVYHSHVLEHFAKKDGKEFIKECHRVLKKNGIIRIAVPDLEQIAREYIKNLEGALQGSEEAKQNYEWIKLEMYDQTVRTKGGGDMAGYIFQEKIPNEEYVFQRVGEEGRNLRKDYLENKNIISSTHSEQEKQISFVRKIKDKVKSVLKLTFFKHEFEEINTNKKYTDLGKFRLEGEIHQWMYDRYSIKKLLEECGFEKVEVKTAFESQIPSWNSYQLETKDNIVFKPDSLFVEAIKL